MQIGLFHGYELVGSGSNEYNRYLARTLLHQSHTVHIICREKNPQQLDFLGEVWIWQEDGSKKIEVLNSAFKGKSVLHQIPCGPVYPVYVTDKQRPGNVKAFVDLSDEELKTFKQINHHMLSCIFEQVQLDILFANHLVMQPSVALEACRQFSIPLLIFPHGSAIEYTVKKDQRYFKEARHALQECDAIVTGSYEIRERIIHLFPDLEKQITDKSQIVGVGVDTALFTPVSQKDRARKLSQFINNLSAGYSAGKSSRLLSEMYEQLELGNWQAVTGFGDRYRLDDLDVDITEKLSRLDFSHPLLIFVGAFTAGKGVQSLLCALPLVLKKLPETQLVLVGSGVYREVLEALIYALVNKNRELLFYLVNQEFAAPGKREQDIWHDILAYIQDEQNLQRLFSFSGRLGDQVMFVGRMDHAQLSCIFPCADLAVFPSVIQEAYPLVLMESLANGVLPLVSYFSGFKEGIDDLNRFLSPDLVERLKIPMQPEQRIEGIAGNIIDLVEILRKTDLSSTLSKIAREHYDWNHRAKAMVKAMDKVVRSTNH